MLKLVILALFGFGCISESDFGDGRGIISSFKSEPVKTGTTIVGICCNDGVVLGADTRSTGGPLVVDKEKLKIHQVSARIFCCAAGTSADCDKITNLAARNLASIRIEKELSGDPKYQIDAISAAVLSIKRSIQHPATGRSPHSVFILGGIDNLGPSLHQIDADGASHSVDIAALG